MSGPFGSSQLMYTSGEAFTLDQSLRFDDDDSAYLSKTFAGAGNRKIWTFSCWVKPSSFSTHRTLFACGTAGAASTFSSFRLNSDTSLTFFDSDGSGCNVQTTQLFRDSSAWYNIILACDTPQDAASDRIKMYVNGEQVTDMATTSYPAEDLDIQINSAIGHQVGSRQSTGSVIEYWDGYMAEVHFIDGTALTPTSFGETGDYGEWKPIEVSGLTYGTNGFYLPFKQDYTVEGFSTVTYKGTGATQYIGGTGFQPDLTWIKGRSIAEAPMLFDAVRGAGNRLMTHGTNAEYYDAAIYLTAFNSDGFSVGGDDGVNKSGDTYVAWNWDMGDSYGLPKTIGVDNNTQHSTAQAKIGASSIIFDGTGDQLDLGNNDDWDFGSTSDFTVETYVRFAATAAGGFGRYSASGAGVTGNWALNFGASTQYWYHGDGASYSFSWTPSTNTWYHVAITRHNGDLIFWVDGTQVGSTQSDSVDYDTSTVLVLGNYRDNTGDSGLNGFLDEFRISNKARYTSSFTPSTTAFSNDANTLFLLHSDTSNGSTTFTDSSGATPNTTGSINSHVAANTTYGQSIVSYTGTGSNATVGHGLSVAPEMVIVRSRAGNAWAVYHTSIGNTHLLELNTTAGQADSDEFWNDTSPTADVFTVGTHGEVNASGVDFISYAFHSVTGYSKFGTYEGTDSTHTVTLGFKPAFLMIKNADASSKWVMFDNTRSPTNNASAGKQMLRANTNEAEQTKTDREPTWLDTGFSIGDSDADTNSNGDTFIYMAFADKREYAYWLDQSGNNNDWTSNNLTESDIMVDSPTNNFCTWNPLQPDRTLAAATRTFSEGNLKILTTADAGDCRVFGTMGMSSGKWYFEWVMTIDASGVGSGIGVADEDHSDEMAYYGPFGGGTGGKYYDGGSATYGAAWVVGDIIGVAFNADTNAITFYVNGSTQGEITSAVDGGQDYFPFVWDGSGSPVITGVANFGQDSSFAGAKTAQGNQDSNDIGDFYYEPPTDYLALCTSNLPAVAVTPSEHFNTLLYTGDGESTHAVTGVGFQPDFIWFKHRTATYHNSVWDAVRGVHKQLYPSGTNAEADESTSVKSFDTDGFTLGDKGNVNNDSGAADNFVAWNWKAGNATLGTGAFTQGTIASTCSRNVDAGFSIVSFTGTGSAGTVGHGLSQAPEMIIVKNREFVEAWGVFHKDVSADPETDYMQLQGTNAVADYVGAWNDTMPAATVFTVGSWDATNNSGDDIIAYCFHSVDGYSKVGSYEGNSNADGTFVYTGFRPAYVIRKRTDGSGHWHIVDNDREGYNGSDSNDVLFANTTSADIDANRVDFLSNGFKNRTTDGDVNGDGNDYIYMAFAETPFKYSNAR